jgi:rhodanese-related sulfurtransferase
MIKRGDTVNTTVETITKEELSKMLGKERLVLLDLRLNWDSAGHKIKTAIHEEPDDVDNWATKYDREIMTVVYCSDPAEKTSRATALKLKQKGFRRVKVLRGGWTVWESAGLPHQRKDAAPTPRGFISEVLTD